MSKKEFVLLNFSLDQIAQKYNLTTKQVYEVLKQFDCISYLVEFYDSIHTQGGGYIVATIESFLEHRSFAGFDTLSRY